MLLVDNVSLFPLIAKGVNIPKIQKNIGLVQSAGGHSYDWLIYKVASVQDIDNSLISIQWNANVYRLKNKEMIRTAERDNVLGRIGYKRGMNFLYTAERVL